MDISELRTRIEEHVTTFASDLDASVVAGVRQFADWLETKQAEEAQAAQYAEWLRARGYTVTK